MKKHKKENEQVTLLGGVELDISHLPREAFDETDLKRLEKFQPLLGTIGRVKVRQIPLSRMAHFGNAIVTNNEAAAIELYCGREPYWADTLTPESANAIADKGLELNLNFFSAWYRRQATWKETQTPEATVQLQKKLAELETQLTGLASRASAAQSPSTTG